MVFDELAAFSGGFRAGLTGKRRPGKKSILISGEEYVLKRRKKRKHGKKK